MANEKIGQVAPEAAPSIADASVEKKVGFFAAMALVVGATIGAGIFLRAGNVLDQSGGSLVMALLAWSIGAFAVMAMALALVEIASARNDNTSFVGWCKTFNSKFIGQMSKNFIAYVYTPVTYFGMPLYVILQLQDAIQGFGSNSDLLVDSNLDWLIWMVISMAISGWSWVTAGLSAKAADWQNRVIGIVKIFPLATACIIGFIYLGLGGASDVTAGFKPTSDDFTNGYEFGIAAGGTFLFSSPFIGFFFAFGGIFFAYDGFYVVAGIQSEMKEPKKTPWALLGGLGIMTIIYLIIAISMSMAGGSIYDFQNWFMVERDAGWAYGIIQLTITIGILGVLNGFSAWAPRLYEDLMAEGDFPFGKKEVHKLNPAKPTVGLKYVMILAIPTIIIFSIIGAFYINSSYNGYGYSEDMERTYAFTDLVMNWLALISFMFIAISIFGGLQNRKTNNVQVEQQKWFVPTAWISVILIGLATLIQFIAPFADLFALMAINKPDTDTIVGRLLTVVALLLIVSVMMVPYFIEQKKSNNNPYRQEPAVLGAR